MSQLMRLRQPVRGDAIPDVREAVRSEIAALDLRSRIGPGSRVAVGVGSRGLTGLTELVAETVTALREAGADPFIVPAMGSHGGATAEGQVKLLAHYGVTESRVGAPILATMETVVVGETESGIPCHVDRLAAGADGIVVINRVKAHTSVVGPVQSGLMKMISVGLGKQHGAELIHKVGLSEHMPAVARTLLKRLPVLFGLATVENGAKAVSLVRAVPGEKIAEVEPELFQLSLSLLPRIPFRSCDLLIVEEIGKEISGTGMDTNVIGRWRREGGPREPDFRTIVVLGLSRGAGGNATGLGLADITTQAAVDAMDRQITYANSLTAGFPGAARIPMHFGTEGGAIETALALYPNPRVIHIRNTGYLTELGASPALLAEAQWPVEQLGSYSLSFDPEGRLSDTI